MKRTRAQRRHELDKAKARATRLATIYANTAATRPADRPKMITEIVKHTYRNRKNCSCAMCCNPRRRGELSLAEIKAALPDPDL